MAELLDWNHDGVVDNEAIRDSASPAWGYFLAGANSQVDEERCKKVPFKAVKTLF